MELRHPDLQELRNSLRGVSGHGSATFGLLGNGARAVVCEHLRPGENPLNRRVTSGRYGVYPIVSAHGKHENHLSKSCRIIGKNDLRVDAFMKKLSVMVVLCLAGAATFVQQSFAQSLGDVARANRAKKHASASAVKLDDDSMPHSSVPSAGSEAEAAKKTDDKSASTKEAESKDAKKDTADAQKKSEELKKQIEGGKKEIASLQRERDIATREARLRAAAYYGDAGTMLRDQAKFAEDARKEQDEINGKKQALDAAQKKLDDLQEQARKSGIRS